MIARQIDGYPKQPRVNLTVAAKKAPPLAGSDESILGKVSGSVPVANQAQEQVINAAIVFFNDGPEVRGDPVGPHVLFPA